MSNDIFLLTKLKDLFINDPNALAHLNEPHVIAAIATAASGMSRCAENPYDEEIILNEVLSLYNKLEDEQVKRLVGMGPQYVKKAIGFATDFNDYSAATATYNAQKDEYDQLYEGLAVRNLEKGSETVQKNDVLHRRLTVNKKIVMIALLTLMISIIAPVSYAWFSASVSGNNDATNTQIKTAASMALILTDGDEVSGSNWVPGNYLEKTFTVKNNGTNPAKYNITISDLINTFADKTDLVYKLESSDGGYNMTSPSQMIDQSGAISDDVTISPNATHTYKLTISFVYLDEDQSDNMGKTFSGKINIIDSNELSSNSSSSLNMGVTLTAKYNTQNEQITAGTLTEDKIQLLYDNTTENNLRYVGNTPDNYVYYNCSTTNQDEMNDTTCEKWRIVGLFNNVEKENGSKANLVKIMRVDSLGKYAWDTSDGSKYSEEGMNQWGPSTYYDGTNYEGADIMRELNTDYLGNTTVGTDSKWYSSANDTKSAMPSTTLNSNAQNMIETVKWNLGTNLQSGDWNNLTPTNMYNYERGSVTADICGYLDSTTPQYEYCKQSTDVVNRTSSWVGKIGLIYASDYGYSTVGGTTKSRNDCLTLTMYNSGWSSNADCKDNTWLHNDSFPYYLINPLLTGSTFSVFAVYPDGAATAMKSGNTQGFDIYPSLYLKDSVKIVDGQGSSQSPYKLSM